MRTVIVICSTAIGVGACMMLARLLGFVDGSTFGVAWQSGVAFALVVRFRSIAALGVFFGYFGAELWAGQPPWPSAADACAHAAAALFARAAMRPYVRKGATKTRTGEWFVFFYGAALFSVTVAALKGVGLVINDAPLDVIASVAPFTAMTELLGITSVAAVLVRLDEVRSLRRIDPAMVGALLLTVFLVGLVGAMLAYAEPFDGRSTIIVLLAVPISIWLSLMPRSLAGAMISLCGYQAALWLVLQDVGRPLDPEYGLVATSYLVLVVAFQLVHALNLDRLAAARQIAEQNDELERRVEERTASLTEMTMRAVSADRAKSEFLAKVSHELRTPLNGIIGLSSVMLSGDLSQSDRANVELINTSGLNLLKLISGVLNFADEKPPEEEEAVFEAFSPRDLLLTASDDARERSDAAQAVAFRLRIADDLPHIVYGDAVGMRRALAALLDNAFKFTTEGEVILGAALSSANPSTERVHRLRFEVLDTGIGVASEDRERIFKPFEQADGSFERVYGGAGLGLAVAAEVVRRNGGEIAVEGALGEGSTFWFEVEFEAAGVEREAA